MSPNRARRARRATIGVTVLLVAVLVLAACRLAGVLIFDWLGNGAFNSQQYAQAEQYYGANMKLNVIEPWIASYDRGTSRAAESNYADAKKDLRAALDMAPQEQKCRVGMNLVWTLEESVTMQNLNRGTAQADTLKEAKAIAQRLKCHGKTTAPQSHVRQTSADQKIEQSTTMKRLDQEVEAQQGSQSQENKPPKVKDSEQQRQKDLSTRNQQALNEQRRTSQDRNGSPQHAPSASTPRTAGGTPDRKGW
ncbi:tetratricopeptide repeat protein [Cutibacterium namnetense]|uniref:tetratricopeptide repeat protein n=1 Tax=Cutibacterium namnetense TaxID=1574624 RepID=UPI0007C65FD3|nr:tetratricopeptide repeat protein [Cutibacterium namnetense]